MVDRFIRSVGKASSWLTLILVILICIDVFMRYVFSNSQEWMLELEWHLFALVFLLGGAYALQADEHVRVDVWYTHRSERTKAWINLLGTVFFLLPWCLVVIYTSYAYAENSFLINERSADPGGLPARYLIKFSITIGFVLLLIQAVMVIIKNTRLIISGTEK